MRNISVQAPCLVAEHYFFHCPSFAESRMVLFQATHAFHRVTGITEITTEITEITMEITEITMEGWGGGRYDTLGWIRIG